MAAYVAAGGPSHRIDVDLLDHQGHKLFLLLQAPFHKNALELTKTLERLVDNSLDISRFRHASVQRSERSEDLIALGLQRRDPPVYELPVRGAQTFDEFVDSRLDFVATFLQHLSPVLAAAVGSQCSVP